MVNSVIEEKDRVYLIDGEIGELRYYGYTKDEAVRLYVHECEYKKMKGVRDN